jgi:hypothetical protein
MGELECCTSLIKDAPNLSQERRKAERREGLATGGQGCQGFAKHV